MANESIRVFSPQFRMIWPELITPKAYTPKTGEKGQPNYSMGMLFESAEDFKKFQQINDKGELSNIDIGQAAVAMVKKAWPNETDIGAFVKAMDMNKAWPFQDGTKLADSVKDGKGEFYRGKKVIRAGATEKYPPNLLVREKVNGKPQSTNLERGVPTDLARAKSLFVGGNYAVAELNMKAIEVAGKPFLKFYINAVVFTKQGERLGGGGSLIGKLDGVYGGIDDQHDPTAGMSDDIPF